MKVAELVKHGHKLRAEFEARQGEFFESQKAYNKAKKSIGEFDRKYGRIMELFKE